MLDFVFRPLRSVLGVAEHEVAEHTPIQETEERILDAVNAIHRATDSIEHHVEVIEGLATSVGPLTDSVNRLTTTMADLVGVLGPMAAVEHGVQRVERLFGRRRHEEKTEPEPGQPES